jgi:hypothetical protein
MAAFESQLTVGKQTAWGTALAAAPTRGIEAKSFSLNLQKQAIESNGIRPGRTTVSEAQIKMVEKGTEGSLEFEVGSRDHGILLEGLFGAAVTAGAGPFTHSFTRAAGTSVLQWQELRHYDTNAGGATINHINTAVMSGSFSVEVDGYLMSTMDLRGRDEVEGTPALATPAYSAVQSLFPYDAIIVTIDGTPVCVESIQINLENSKKGDRYKICAGGLDQPAVEGMQEDSISLGGIQFDNLTHYNRFRASTFHSIVVTCTAQNGTDTLVFTAPKCLYGSTPLPDMDVDNVLAEVDIDFRCATPAAGGSAVSAVLTTGQSTL